MKFSFKNGKELVSKTVQSLELIEQLQNEDEELWKKEIRVREELLEIIPVTQIDLRNDIAQQILEIKGEYGRWKQIGITKFA
jgi:hypothetical protein